MYSFCGAFCADGDGRAAALANVFPSEMRRRFTRSDTPADIPQLDDLWCPPSGLLAVALRSEYTLFNGPRLFDDEEAGLAFLEVLSDGLPQLSQHTHFVALHIECTGGTCGAEIREYAMGRHVSTRSCSPEDYSEGLRSALQRLGCVCNKDAVFPPLIRCAFSRFGQAV